MTQARFPHVPADAATTSPSTCARSTPRSPRGAWIRCTTHQRPGPPADRLAVVHVVRRRRPGAVRGQADARRRPRRPGRLDRDRRQPASGRPRRAAAPTGRAAPRTGCSRCPAAPRRSATSRASGCTARRCRARSSRARRPTRSSPAGSRPAAGGSRSAGWRGMAGHNWGAEHAATWIWLHGTAFDETPGAWLDLSVGRVRVGPVLTPWIANGALRRGRRADPPRRPAPGARRGHAGRLPRRRARAPSIEARSPAGQTVAWRYADPGGGEHHSLNCSIAELRVRLARPGRPAVELHTAHGGVYELGIARQRARDPRAAVLRRLAPRAPGPRPPRSSRGGTRTG